MDQPNMMYYGNMQPQAATRFENALTPDEIEQLSKKASQFSIAITNEERLRGICNHRTADGTKDALVEDPITGNMRCQICGYEFKPVDPSVSIEDIKDSVQVIENILQTIKLLYIDLPPEAARDYFQIIPLIDKIPELFEFAAKNFSKHGIDQWNMYGNQPGTINMFNNLLNLFGGGQMMQQPVQQPAPGFMNQPAGYPSYGAPMMGGMAPVGYPGQPSNGFGFLNASQYQPQTGAFAYTPPQMTTPAQPTVAPEAAAETDTVNTTVKA